MRLLSDYGMGLYPRREPPYQCDALNSACDEVFIDKASSAKLASHPELSKALMVVRGEISLCSQAGPA